VASKQCHGEINYLLRLEDDDGLAFEPAKPMSLLTMVPFNAVRLDFAYD
jgi:hypothetical protein